jgi:YggT family protein
MDFVLGIVSLLLLVVQLLLVARAVLDWSLALAGPARDGSARSRLIAGVHAVTEPILAPVRRVVPPLRLGGVGIDLSFIIVFLAIVLIRAVIS